MKLIRILRLILLFPQFLFICLLGCVADAAGWERIGDWCEGQLTDTDAPVPVSADLGNARPRIPAAAWLHAAGSAGAGRVFPPTNELCGLG